MPDLDLVRGGAPRDVVERFELAYADEAGEQRVPLAHAGSVLFEDCRPVRDFPSYKGQRHFTGRWWTATTSTLIGYESWLERDTLMMLDFDADAVAISSQPFWLFWTTDDGRPRSHAPDYFARLAEGSARVVDCRPAERIKPRDQVAFDATREACTLLGWHYEVVDAAPEVLVGNVRWLAGYRHPRHDLPQIAGLLRAICTKPMGLLNAAQLTDNQLEVLPVLFHLLWRGDLTVDLATPLHPDAIVTTTEAVAT